MPKLNKKIKTISLFSGAGGLDIGFHRAGFDIVACVEIDGNHCRTLEANRGHGKTFDSKCEILCQDVRTFDARKYLGTGVECIIGGPPCQTFSAAGRRSGGVLGTGDARGRLFTAYCDILRVLRPKVFVFENVYGLSGANNGGPWKEIVAACTALGYRISADVLDTADYGVPQHRERLIMVGYLEGEFEFPFPTNGPDSPTGLPHIAVADAIYDLQDAAEPEHNNLGGLYGHLLPLVPPGLNYSFFTREMGYPQPIFAWRSKFHDFLYKVDPERPSRTVKAQPGKFTGPFHWKNRHFTVAEFKRLQSFPDDYRIVGTPTKIQEQIGNSVPPELARVIATSVREQLLRPKRRLTYERRPAGFVPTFRVRQRERTKHFKNVAKAVIADRFGTSGHGVLTNPKTSKNTTYFTFESNFIESRQRRAPSANIKGEIFKRVVTKQDRTLELDIGKLFAVAKVDYRIEICGLERGMHSTRELAANARIDGLLDTFYVWRMIEDTLVTHSEFLTLIDIYGHYANRGDDVTIRSELYGIADTPVARAFAFFGDSTNCGASLPEHVVANQLGIEEAEIAAIVSSFRKYRFDIRTNDTHPTIAPGMMLCTYPFPLLSGKAHFERKPRAASLQLPNLVQQHLFSTQ